MTAVERCSSCKHWDRAEAPPGIERPADEVRSLLGDWGDCQRVKHLGQGPGIRRLPDVEQPTDDPAFLSDGSGYFASLTTRSDFGCTLYELREETR